MLPRAVRFCLILIASVMPLMAGAAELRVLVDVSGSMKRNDPANLREAASNLVVELLPESAEAGIWMFATEPVPLIAPGPATGAWKALARTNVTQIHSRGQFTDIESILDAATADWRGAPGDGERAVLLLTDGVVDVADGDEASTRSRAVVLERLAPALRSAGVVVHTVALSEHADVPLLTALAEATDGRFELAKTAETLNRVFLRMFEQSVERDAVPLVGNEFRIDASISEFTVLAFRDGAGTPVVLETPDGRRLTASAPGEGVAWRPEDGYDLVTVRSPATGTWRLAGVADPDNRVMIVTDLGLKTDDLPRYLLADEGLDVRFHLTEAGEPITRTDFLDVVEASVDPGTGAAPLEATLSEALSFEASVPATGQPGEIALAIIAEGGTFQRVVNRRVTVIDNPLELVTQTEQRDDGTARVVTRLVANEDIVDPASIRLTTAVTGPDGAPELEQVPAPLTTSPTHEFDRPGTWRVTAMASARTTSGREVSARAETAPIVIADPDAPVLTEAPLEEAPAETVSENRGLDPLTLGLILGPANLALIGGIAFTRRRLAPSEIPDAGRPEKKTKAKKKAGSAKKAKKSKK